MVVRALPPGQPLAATSPMLSEDGSILVDPSDLLAVWKPTRGERPLFDFPIGTLTRREVSAYLVSEATGWGIVPPTLLRDGPFGEGMIQQWIEVDPDAEARWTEMVDRGAATAPFGERSYFFGSNIPGKPRKYLLNSGGRPKLFKEIARVVDTDYASFRLSRVSDGGDRRQG